MRLIAIVLFCLLFPGADGFAKLDTPEDTLNQLDSYKQKQGYWIYYGRDKRLPGYEPDQKVEEGRYVDNRKYGVWTKYYASGGVQHEITYKNSRPHGYAKIYYTNGNIKEEGMWKGRRWKGVYKEYFENGCLYFSRETDTFKFGRKDSCGVLLEHYRILTDADGNINAKILLTNLGEAVDTVMVEPYKARTVPQKREGQPVKRFQNANPKIYDGRIRHTLYNKDRQISREGEFENNMLVNGKWYRYDSEGLLQRIEVYKKGRYIGDAPME